MLRNVRFYQHLLLWGGSVVLVTLLVFFLVSQAISQDQMALRRNRLSNLAGPKRYYMALGDSLAFGFQPDFNFVEGYASDFYINLEAHGARQLANLGCPGETSITFINGGCPHSSLRKYPYGGPQLDAALSYLKMHAGQVSPVTFDIGANDVVKDVNIETCKINAEKFKTHLARIDENLKQIILPKLHAALMVNGRITGDLLMMNYYDPFQNVCPNTLPYVQIVNQHLANDVKGYGTIVDVFSAFGGAKTPNPHICSYTWMCVMQEGIHPSTRGYQVIAGAFEMAAGY
jgi:lysophospholipase L1-like esterase